jgi:hypothetical protein
MEEIEYSILHRWFVGLNLDEQVWDVLVREGGQGVLGAGSGDALLARKGRGKEAKLSYNGNLLVENRNGLIVNAELLQANGRAERDAALLMLEHVPGDSRITVGGDKGFDTAELVDQCRHMM